MESKAGVNLTEFCKLFGCSYSRAVALAKSGQLPALKIGRSYIIPNQIVEKIINLELKIG